jgi:hypothetical protein
MNAASKGPDVDDVAHEIEALAFKVSEEFDQCLCVCKNTVTFALLPPRSGLDTARSLWNGMVDGD